MLHSRFVRGAFRSGSECAGQSVPSTSHRGFDLVHRNRPGLRFNACAFFQLMPSRIRFQCHLTPPSPRRVQGGSKSLSVAGFLSWVAWRSAYLTRLGSIPKRLTVAFDWTMTFFFGRDMSRW